MTASSSVVFRRNREELVWLMFVLVVGGAFALITYFVGFLGAIPLAIHQAGIQLVHLSILPAVAIADAGSVLVGPNGLPN